MSTGGVAVNPVVASHPVAQPMPERRACAHCGTLFTPAEGEGDYCSPACRVVHDRLLSEHLDQFYVFSRGKSGPVSARVFHPRDDTTLAAHAAAIEAEGRTSGEFTVEGVSCLGCVWLIEELFARQPGAVACRLSPATGRARLEWKPGQCDLPAFARKLQEFGYTILPPGARAGAEGDTLSRRLGLCAAFAMNAMLFTLPAYLGMHPGDQLAAAMIPVTCACATGAVLVGGTFFLRRAWQSLRLRSLHIDLPIALGILAAFAGSLAALAFGHPEHAYFDFVAIFTFLMLAGRWVQERAASAARAQLQTRVFEPGPISLPDAGAASGSLHERITPGARYSVEAGGVVPTRSILKSASAEFNLDWIDGEPAPRLFQPGSMIPSGAGLIGDQPALLESVESWKGSMLDQLSSARPEAQGRLHSSVENSIRWYLLLVLLLSTAGGVAWWLAGHPVLALHVFVSVLVVSCPCALGIAIPLADELGAATLKKFGVHVLDPSVWSRLEKVRIVAFDKTGTLTRHTLRLEEPHVLDSLDGEAQSVLHAMTSASLHPVARCLRETLALRHAPAPDIAAATQEFAGLGLDARCQGVVWRLGRANWAASSDSEDTVFTRDGAVLCRMRFVEQLRDDAQAAVQSVSASGRRIVLLSGDKEEHVRDVAAKLGLPGAAAHARMSPGDKAAWVKQHPADAVLMIGDGGNDSLAFAAAACRGAPASDRGMLESRADFFLTGDRLGGIASLFNAVNTRTRAIRVLMWFALAYNATVVCVALAGWMNPLLAAVLMPMSSLIALAIVFSAFRRV